MRRIRSAAIQPGSAAATALPVTHTKSIYAADMGAARPVSAERARRVHPNPRLIAIGSSEQTRHGRLVCERTGADAVVVKLLDGTKQVGRALMVRVRGPHAQVPEAAFSCEIDEFIGTPWHELSYTSVWTVHGLRTKGEAELTIDR